MPMLTMSVIFLPVAPLALPERTASANSAMAASTLWTSGMTSAPSTMIRIGLGRAQRDVQHGAILGDVDLFAGKHRVAAALDVGGLGQRQQQRHRLAGHRAFRPVEQQAAGRERELREAPGVGREGGAHVGRRP